MKRIGQAGTNFAVEPMTPAWRLVAKGKPPMPDRGNIRVAQPLLPSALE
jgi:hypothetical protein